jgi:FdhE protein
MTHPAAPSRHPYAHEELRREAEQRWRRLGEAYPELAERIAFARGLVALYIDDLPAPAPVSLTVEQARRKFAAGRPLLDGEDFDVDIIGLRHLFYRLCSWASRQPALAEGGARLERALLDAELPIEAMFDAALTRDDAALDAVARRVDVPTALVSTLAGYLVVAALMSTARALGPLLAAANHRWEYAICPVCGGPPLLAEVLGGAGDRWLRCAGCGTGWPFPDDRCVRCGTTESGQREILSVGEQVMPNRLEVCRRCRGTLKLATVPLPTPPELLTIVDTAFVALEEAAGDPGYGRAAMR